MEDHKVLGMKPRRKLSFFGRIMEAVRVGFCMLTVCAISILGISSLVWAALVALDPRHSLLEAMFMVARFDRIPLGLASGLAVFFAAVTWDSARIRLDSFETLADRDHAAVRFRRRLHQERE